LNTKEEFTEYYNNLYNKLLDPKKKKKKPLKCIPLTSVNPAYNPYHNSLIIGNKDVNIITNVGRSISGDDKKSTFDNLVKDNDGNYNIEQCCLVYNMKGAIISCSIRVSNTIEDSAIISDTSGNTYHQSYGIVSSDTNTILEASVASTNGNIISKSESNSQSNASERTITYPTSKSHSSTDDINNTHTTTYNESYAHTISEEHSHAKSKGGSVTNESNWSKSEEVSHMEEYSRMDINDYNNVKNTPKKRYISKRGFLDGLTEANDIARDANKYTGEANDIAKAANALTERSIESEEEIARQDRELQRELNAANSLQELNIALVGTKSTSDTHTNCSTWIWKYVGN